MNWKNLKTYKYETKVTINLKKILSIMFNNKELDYEKIKYKVSEDFENKRIIVDFRRKR